MDVTITAVTGGGRKANRRAHSYTLKEVVTVEQVVTVLKEEFQSFFDQAQITLEEVPEKKKSKAKG